MSRALGKDSERGAELVEFSLVLIPLLLIAFAMMNVAWLFFAKASLQYAVQTGVRFAVTGNIKPGLGQDASIKQVVQDNAMGFLDGSGGHDLIAITFYSPGNLALPLSGAGSNAGGNIVKVSVDGLQLSVLAPMLGYAANRVTLSANASDITESSPNGTPPTR